MAIGRYQFDRFSLDPLERRLYAGEAPVDLNSRYFDALLLLLQHPGKLLSKERFLQEVWQAPQYGAPVASRPGRFLRHVNVGIALPVVIVVSPAFSREQALAMFVLHDFCAVVRGSALATKREWKEAFFRIAWLRRFLGKLEVANGFRLHRRPNRVSTSEKLVQSEGKYRKST